ncbi:MAG: 2-oxoacid:acceptor oxidoreductase family protein [Armatimonadota bacterium]
MREELFMAGLGGQGVNLAGQLIARTGMDLGLNVSWFPIYEPEVRGGSSTCTVILTNERVGSPTSDHPTSMILMTADAVERFAAGVAPGGLIVINSSLAQRAPAGHEARVLMVPANQIAAEIGNDRVANMALLGAWAAGTGIMGIEDIAASLRALLPERHQHHMPANEEGLRRGALIGRAAALSEED